MTLPTILPGWIPPWAQLALLALAVLLASALLLMPFAVFGLKGRLDLLEAQLDDIHSDLRLLATRIEDAEEQRARRRVVVDPDARGAERARERAAKEHPREPSSQRDEPHLRWPPGTDRR